MRYWFSGSFNVVKLGSINKILYNGGLFLTCLWIMWTKFHLVLLVLVLSACGFHLKGDLPNGLFTVPTSWYVVGGALQKPLETTLQQHQATISKQESPHQAQIRVLSFETKKDIYTLTRVAKLNEYLLSMRVVAQAYRNGQVWGAPMTVTVQRVMSYSDSMVLGKDYEEQALWENMQQDAAEQIVRQLAFLRDE